MRRSALWSAFVLLVATALYGGCTQNFDQFTSGTGGSSSASTGANMGGNGGSGGMPCEHVVDCGQPKTCEQFACVGHMCQSSQVAAETPCVTGKGAGFCTAGGACVECIQPSDCPSAPECQENTCTNNKCGTKNAPDMKHVCGNNNALNCVGGMCTGCTGNGDCTVNSDCQVPNCDLPSSTCIPGNQPADMACTSDGGAFCDGMGNCKQCGTMAAGECTDQPPDCMVYQCTNNACMLVDGPSGNSCTTGGKVCDGNGNCVACDAPADCGNDTTCKQFTCTSHACGTNDAAINTSCNSGEFCDGNGNCVACNMASQCPAGACKNPTCMAHACGTTNQSDGSTCAGGVCLTGSCVQCIMASDCTAVPPDCKVNACNGSHMCVQNNASDGTMCSTGVCLGGSCVQCINPSDCGANPCKNYTCNGGHMCGSSNKSDGTSCSPPAGGMCTGGVCG